MSKYKKYLEEDMIKEGKGLFDIISGLFGDFFKHIKLTRKAEKVRQKFQDRLKSETDADGNISKTKANQLMDDMIAELEDLANKSGMSQSGIDNYIETINKTRKRW